MHIQEVSATNFKGRTFAVKLDPLTQIVGRNFSGKTSIVDAVRLAFLGSIPEIGKTNAATWNLASGTMMNIGVTMDTGIVLERTFRMVKDSVTGDYKGPIQFEKCDFPFLNSEHYFGLTDAERVAYVFSRAKLPQDFTKESIITKLERISFGEEHTELLETVKADVIGMVKAEFESKPVNEALEGMLKNGSKFRSEFQYGNKRSKDTIGAVRTLADLKNKEGECSSERAEEIQRQIETKRAELRGYSENLGALRARADEAARVADRRVELIDLKEMLPETIKTAESELKPKLAIIAQEKKKLNPPDNAEHREKASRLGDLESLMGQINGKLAASNKIIAKAREGLAQLDEVKECPFCKSHGKGWKKGLDEDYRIKIADEEIGQPALREQYEAALSEAAEIRRWLLDADKQREEYDRSQRIISNLEGGDIPRITRRRDEAKTRLAGIQAELDTFKSVEAPTDEERRAVVAITETLRGEIQQLEDAKTVAANLQQDIKRAAQAELEHHDAAAHVLILGEIGAHLKTIQAAIVEKVFGGICDTANAVVGNLLLTPLAFFEGQIGRWHGARFITHKTFSGTEKALCFVSIAVALSLQAPFKLVILDEMGRLDSKMQARVMEALAAAQELGSVDQVLVVNTVKRDNTGWKTLVLEEKDL